MEARFDGTRLRVNGRGRAKGRDSLVRVVVVAMGIARVRWCLYCRGLVAAGSLMELRRGQHGESESDTIYSVATSQGCSEKLKKK